MIKYNNLKMKILDTVKIGSVVQVNLDSTKERLSEKTIKAISNSSKCIVKDYKITDGLGIGLVLELSNGDKEWFFENEEEGIILEDDCYPSQSFFWFCEELLTLYKYDMRVWNIGGFKPSFLKGDSFSYNFSRFTHFWGWASWADRWKHYDVTISRMEGTFF